MRYAIYNFGGGLNSTAMILEAMARGLSRPRAILFADTGAERAGTMRTVELLSQRCVESGWPSITVVNNYERPNGKLHHYRTLEEECLGNETLPGLAYGFRGCSRKWKVQPMDRWIKAQQIFKEVLEAGARITRFIGYDAGEPNRSVDDDKWFRYEFPLREWGIDRDGCKEIVRRGGFPMPTKSACFFCPAMKKKEILALYREKPDLFARAVEMERVSAPSNCKVKGLGRRFAWSDIPNATPAQLELWGDVVEPCIICWDGSSEG